MFPEGWDRGAISYMEGERVPKSWCIKTKNLKNICVICEVYSQRWDVWNFSYVFNITSEKISINSTVNVSVVILMYIFLLSSILNMVFFT